MYQHELSIHLQGGVIPIEFPQAHEQAYDASHAPATIASNTSASAILDILTAVAATNPIAAPAVNGAGSHLMLWDPGEGNDTAGGYNDYSPSYGWYSAAGGIDGGGSNAVSDGAQKVADEVPKTANIPDGVTKYDGSHANITFTTATSDGLASNAPVKPQLVQTTSAIISQTPGVSSANVYATTNGDHTGSDHVNGAAVDINNINGNSVSSTAGRSSALQLEAQALADPNTRYVEGPGGNWSRTSVGGQWAPSNALPGMNTHVHWSVFRGRSADITADVA